jgi:hypothetical protein
MDDKLLNKLNKLNPSLKEQFEILDNAILGNKEILASKT